MNTYSGNSFNARVHGKLGEFPVVPAFFVFISWFLTAKFSQYIFFHLNTSPAVIWPPCGIALAAVLLYGYKMWVPIMGAALLAALTNSVSVPLPLVFGATIAQTFAPILGAYFLKRFNFSHSFANNRDVLKFFGIIILVASATPTVVILIQFLTHSLPSTPFVSWSRSWAGRLLSMLILTPFIVTWLPWKSISPARKKMMGEILLIFALFFAVIYVLFWTSFAQSLSFLLLLALFGVLFWIALRLDSRAMTLSLFLLTAFGMTGAIFVQNSTVPLNQRMFSIELFIVLIAPIFLAFSSLMQESRSVVLKLGDNMRQLEEAMRKLNNEDRSKNEFIATLAHELRNPLAPVVSTLEFLKMQNQTPEALKMIEAAEEQTRVMRRLLDDLLDVARVVQKKFKLQKQIIDLRSVITQCLYSVESVMQSRHHTLVLTIFPKEEVYLNVDKVRFEQIIVNLLNNAAKYTKSGGRIELSCVALGDKLEVRVQDNGIGISQEDLKYIFESFRQIKPKPQAGTGLGVGLSLARQLVKMHGGDIRAESDGIGKGSTFVVTFPLSRNMPTHSRNFESNAVKIEKYESKRGQPLRVLVVDDNKPAAEGLGKLLKMKGYEVSVAYDGANALRAAKEFNPRAIVLDIGLPDMDGYEVARRLRSDNFSAAIIALSGYGQSEDKLKAQNAGFNHHLTKPVGIAELENALVCLIF